MYSRPRDDGAVPSSSNANRLTELCFCCIILYIQPAKNSEVAMACAIPFAPAQVVTPHGTLEDLEAEITELWGYLNAATYRFLVLVAEFDREQGFARHCLVISALWLNWIMCIPYVCAW